MDERVLCERLIAADTSTLDGLRSAAGFVKGWLEARDIDVAEHDFEGLPVLVADGRPAAGRRRPDGRSSTATSTSSRPTPSSSRRASRATA